MTLKDWLISLAEKATPDIDACVTMLGPSLEWIAQFKETEQDPEWHGEGNVHIHTGMVLDELYKLLESEARHIVAWRRQALILGTILHDIAKPVRTKRIEIKGIERVAAPAHESVGRSYLAFKMMEWDLPFQVVWTVLNLVGEHHMPKMLAIKDRQKADYLKLAAQADTELLYWLEVADMRGRICPDLDEQLMYLDEFRDQSIRHGVWSENAFANDLSHDPVKTALSEHIGRLSEREKQYVYAVAKHQTLGGQISIPEEALAKTYAHRENHPHLIVMCGPSGSGKSTWVEKNYPDHILISLDELRQKINGKRNIQKNRGQVIQQAKEDLKQALRDKKGVVWDATNLRKDFRSIVCSLGFDYHALVSLIVFLLPESQIHKNNAKREHEVPESVLLKQLASYQIPLIEEAHQYQVIGDNGRILFQHGYDFEPPDKIDF